MFIKSVNATNHDAELVHKGIKCTLKRSQRMKQRAIKSGLKLDFVYTFQQRNYI